jgi:hypothetical protein
MAADALLKLVPLRIALTLAIIGTGVAVGTQATASNAANIRGHARQATYTADTAGTQSVHESARLHLVGSRGTSFNEQGQGSGTFNGPLHVHYTVYATHATLTFSVSTRAGSVSGQGSTSFTVEGSTTYFTGSLAITHGTGSYAHDSATSLHLTGTLTRPSLATTVSVSGSMHT